MRVDDTRRFIGWIAISGALVLVGCGSGDSRKVAELERSLATERKTVEQLKLRVQAEQAHVAALRAVNDEAAAVADAPVAAAALKPAPAAAMCFKDYCPCDLPQGGPDSVLCDQLEQGIAVDPQMMIAGRGMREARRQLETGDY